MVEDAERMLMRRFARTVRVATATALAEYELSAMRTVARGARFQALAAKGVGAWRFPEAGITSADGLLTATVDRSAVGAPERLVLQANGAAGLDLYAGTGAVLSLGGFAGELPLSFDGNGRAVAHLADLDIEEDELSSFYVAGFGP